MSYFHEFLRSPMVMSGYLGSNPYGGKYCSRLEVEWKATGGGPPIGGMGGTGGNGGFGATVASFHPATDNGNRQEL